MSCEMEADVMIKCDNKTNTTTTVDTTITPKSICCRNNTPTKDVPATTTVQTRATHTEKTTISLCTCQDVKCATSIGLGVVVGLLVALLAVITTGWMWTCWTTKRRQRITTNSRDIR